MLPSQFLLAIFWSFFPPIATRWKSAATVMQTMMQIATAMPVSMAVVTIEANSYMVSSSEISGNILNSESCMLGTKKSAKSSLPRQRLSLQLSGSLILEPSFSQKVLTIFFRNRRTWNLSGIFWDFSAPQPSPVPTTNACVGWSPGKDLSVPQLPFYKRESAVWPTLRRSNGRPSFNDIEV